MSAPTTLRLPDELKDRIAASGAGRRRIAACGMVEAIERQAALAEARASFVQAAEQSAREVDAGGALYAAEDVIDYLVARTATGRAHRPKPIAKSMRPPAKAASSVARKRRVA